MKQVDILIVGAGLAGLMAARRLLGRNEATTAVSSLLVVDKGRGVGGRLATRRIGPGRADHGAQFFTVRSPRFRTFVDGWQAQGVVYEWSRGWSDGSLASSGIATNRVDDGYPRYAVRGGMTALAKQLAQGVPLRLGVELGALTAVNNQWHATDQHGTIYQSRAVLLTPPVPQSLALLANGGTTLHPADAEALAQLRYAPCICGLFWVEGAVALPSPGALQRPDHRFSWLADNQRKGISAVRLITVHASPNHSRALWDEPAAESLALLQAELTQFMASGAVVREAQLKKWRYALPETLFPAPVLQAKGVPPLLFAGDAFDGPRVEGAALSGLAAAEWLLGG